MAAVFKSDEVVFKMDEMREAIDNRVWNSPPKSPAVTCRVRHVEIYVTCGLLD